MPELVGVSEIAELLEVSRQRVDQLVHDDPTFPPAEAELAAGRIWRRDTIIAWAKSKGRIGRDSE